MTSLAVYHRACDFLAKARLVGDVLAVQDMLAHVRLHARRVADRDLMAEAAVKQLESERVLGGMLDQLQAAGQLGAAGGRRKKGDTRATLEEIGVKKKKSANAQKAAALELPAFEALCQSVRNKIKSGGAIVVDPIDDGAIIAGARSIMSSRVEPDDSLDYFPTPPFATRALIELVFKYLKIVVKQSTVKEPACGEGHIAEVLAEYFAQVFASDIFDYGYGDVQDFLDEHTSQTADWFITNPPFGELVETFLLRMLQLARVGVAIFVRLQWLEGEGRYERIFSKMPPTCIAFFSERVPLCKGRWDPEGGTATAYLWLVWIKGHKPQAPFWIPPICKDTLTRPDDVARFTTNPVTRRAA